MKVLSVTAILSCLVALVYSVQVQNPGEQDNEITAAGIEPQQPSTTQAVSPFGVPAEYQLTLDFNVSPNTERIPPPYHHNLHLITHSLTRPRNLFDPNQTNHSTSQI